MSVDVIIRIQSSKSRAQWNSYVFSPTPDGRRTNCVLLSFEQAYLGVTKATNAWYTPAIDYQQLLMHRSLPRPAAITGKVHMCLTTKLQPLAQLPPASRRGSDWILYIV